MASRFLYDVFYYPATAIRVPETAYLQQLEIMYVNESSPSCGKKIPDTIDPPPVSKWI
jgi:hypothetical protein